MTTRAVKKLGLRILAPPLAAAILLASMAIGGVDVVPVPGREAYFRQVAASIESIPYAIEDWRGQDEEVIQAARKLLKPTAMLQRRYVRPGDGSFGLLVVHCKDVRDMEGHYPPICYPSQGWTPDGRSNETITVGGETVPMRRYIFERSVGLETSRIVVWDVFVMPGEEHLMADIDGLTRAARSTRRAGLGAAQVQVLMPEGSGQERPIVEACLTALLPTIETIAEGTQDEQSP